MIRAFSVSLAAFLTLAPSAGGERSAALQARGVRELAADLSSADAADRARAACELRELGDTAVDAIPALVAVLGDGAPVESSVCSRRWCRR